MQQVELARLSRQCQAIVTRLQQGPASNTVLAGYSLKYTSRISDLRAKGYDIRVDFRDTRSGVTVYRLHTGVIEQLALL